MRRPGTSVIVPAYRMWSTLPTTFEALSGQRGDGEREFILVESSGDLVAGELRRRVPGWFELVALPARVSSGRARNLGCERARGDLVAFTDADAVPAPDWLDELERALAPGFDAAAGAVLNGTPRSAIGTAGYLLEFSDWLPGRRKPLRHAAGCNLLIRREALERTGGFDDEHSGEDTVLTFALARAGRLAWAPRARVWHRNRTGVRAFLAHQRRLGRGFAHVCQTVDFPHRRLARPSLAPLAAVLRLIPLAGRLARAPREAASALMLLPLLVAGLAAWGLGLAEASR